MTTLTVNIPNEKDLPVLQEILDRFGLTYTVDPERDYPFTAAEIESFVKTKREYLVDKTTARA